VATLADIIAYLHTEEIEEEEEADLSGVEVIVQDDGTVIYPAAPESDEEGDEDSQADGEAAERRLSVRLIDDLRMSADPDDLLIVGIGGADPGVPGTLALAEDPGLVAGYQGTLLICDPDTAAEETPESGAAVLVSERARLVFALIVDRFFPDLLDDVPPRFHGETQADQAALAHACVMNAFLGPRVTFGPHASVGCTDTEYERAPDGRFVRLPQTGSVILEGETEIGAQATVHRALLGETRLCKGAKVGPWSEIGAGATLGRNAFVGADARVGREARIGVGAVIEASAAVADGVQVGDGARVLTGSVVQTDVPAGETWGGDPAQRVDQH